LPAVLEKKAPAVVTERATRKYRVLKPIHHAKGNSGRILLHDQTGTPISVVNGITEEKAYYPKEWLDVPPSVPSGGHGQLIPTDCSGIIELTDEEAIRFEHGQIEALEPGAPTIRQRLFDLEAAETSILRERRIEPAGVDPGGQVSDQLIAEQRRARMAAVDREIRKANEAVAGAGG